MTREVNDLITVRRTLAGENTHVYRTTCEGEETHTLTKRSASEYYRYERFYVMRIVRKYGRTVVSVIS